MSEVTAADNMARGLLFEAQGNQVLGCSCFQYCLMAGPDVTPEVMCFLDTPAIRSLMFFPRKQPVDPVEFSSFSNTHITKPFDIKAHGGVTLHCYVHQAVKPTELSDNTPLWVVYFHGNGELAQEYVTFKSAPSPLLFAALGLSVIFVEYRGYGGSGGRAEVGFSSFKCNKHPKLMGTLNDIAYILPALNVDESKVVVFGRSLGSLFAIKLASLHPRIAGIILESGVAEINSVWGKICAKRDINLQEVADAEAALIGQKTVLNKYQGYEILQNFLNSQGPSLILHTKHDRLVPYQENGYRLHQFASSSGHSSTLVAFEKGGHNDIYDKNPDEYDQAVNTFFSQHFGVVINKKMP